MFGIPKSFAYTAPQAVQALFNTYTANPKGIVAGKRTVGIKQLASKSNVKMMVQHKNNHLSEQEITNLQ